MRLSEKVFSLKREAKLSAICCTRFLCTPLSLIFSISLILFLFLMVDSPRKNPDPTTEPEPNANISVQEAIAEVKAFADEHRVLFRKIQKKGGTQLVFILTTFRSGSSFFGNAIASHPAIFFHDEPLKLNFGFADLYDGESLETDLQILENLAECRYDLVKDTLKYWEMAKMNSKLMSQCKQLGKECRNVQFHQETCRMFPVQLFKITRLRGKAVRQLQGKFPSAKIIYLVRDPRATFSSRTKTPWCNAKDNPECLNITRFCHDLLLDLYEIQRFQQTYQDINVQIIKYEKMAMASGKTFRRIFSDFLDLDWNPSIQKYIVDHTTKYIKGPSSTFRISGSTLDQWKHELSQEKILNIEKECRYFISYFGYDVTRKQKLT